MPKIEEKSKLPTIIFISASLTIFVLLGVLYMAIYLIGDFRVSTPTGESNSKYYFKENFFESDPFITKSHDLKYILDGPIISALDPSQGLANAPVAIVYFADFLCQYCKGQERVLKKVIEKYESEVRLIWKDYPEADVESDSYRAAVAGRCAQAQDMFWPYHDFLFDSKFLNDEAYINIADILNLDMKQFTQCLATKEPVGLVKDNITEANALEIKGIPFIYINDQEVIGEISLEELERIVEIELNKIR